MQCFLRITLSIVTLVLDKKIFDQSSLLVNDLGCQTYRYGYQPQSITYRLILTVNKIQVLLFIRILV